jgi:hypothetical protein
MSESLPKFQQQLIDVLKAKNLAEPAIVSFLQAFDVPPENTGLREQAGRIAHILKKFAPKLSGSGAQELAIHGQVAEAIHGVDEIAGNPEFLLGWGDASRPFLHGCYEEHPFYCLLSREANPASTTVEFMTFLGQFSFAYLTWRPKTKERVRLRERACRAARRLGKTTCRSNSDDQSNQTLKVLPIALASLPSTACTPEDYRRHFSKQARTAPSLNAKEIEQDTLEDIAMVLDNTLPEERPQPGRRPGQTSKTKTEGQYIVRKALPGSEQELIDVTPPEPLIDNPNEPDDGADKSENSTITYMKVRSKNPVFTTEDDRYRRIANSNRSASQARSNQCLPLAFDGLNAFDLEQLCRMLESSSNCTGTHDPEMIMYVALQLASGQPRESILNTTLTTPSQPLKPEQIGYTKRGLLQFRTWCGQKKTRSQNQSGTAPYADQITIHLPRAASSLASEWISHAGLKAGQKLFTSPPDALIKRAEKFLKSINSDLGTRLSVSRIEGFLYRQLAQMPGSDPSVAIYLTGQLDNCSFSPASYTAWPLASLAKFYHQCQQRIAEWAEIAPGWLDGKLEHDGDPSMETGSSLCPAKETILSFAKETRAALVSAHREPPNHLSVVAKHNIFVAAFYAFLEFSLGARAVAHLLLHPECLNLDIGVLYLSDKDNHAYYHARMIHLPEPVIQAFRHLEDHTNALIGHLVHLNPAMALDLRWSSTPTPNGQRPRDIKTTLERPRLLFTLDTDGEICPLLPGSAMKRWKKRTSLALNSFRHSFRTYARRSGEADAVVRAAQGHWSVGQEPTGRFSGMPPCHLKKFSEGWMTSQLEFNDRFSWLSPVSPLLK